MEWFGAKTLYEHTDRQEADGSNLFEERIVLILADNFDDAILKSEVEGNDYAYDDSGIKYLGYVNVFKLFDSEIADKTEVFSLMRSSQLKSNEYINTFFDTGKERT